MHLHIVTRLDDGSLEADAWNRLLGRSATPVPFLRYEYLRLWWHQWARHEWGDDISLFVVVARDARGTLLAAAPWFLAADARGRRVLRFIGGDALTDYSDVLVPPALAGAFWQAVAERLLVQPAFDALDLTHIPQTSPTLTAAPAALTAAGWTARVAAMETAPQIDLPATWDAYLQALPKKQRHELRRKMRRAEAHQPRVRMRTVHTPAEVARQADAFLRLMAYNPRKAAFLTPPVRAFFRALMDTAARHGWLHLAFLDVGERPAAAYLAFDFAQRLWMYNSGLDPAFAALSPGWVLAGHLIRRAIAHGYRVLDWMRGDEAYKYRLGARDFHLYRLTAQPAV